MMYLSMPREMMSRIMLIKKQGSHISGRGDHDPLSSYSPKVRSDDEWYSSDDDERGKGR